MRSKKGIRRIFSLFERYEKDGVIMENNLDREAFITGYKKGKRDTEAMIEDADGCVGCAFEDVESWQPPCSMCKRNCKDYWRAKKECI